MSRTTKVTCDVCSTERGPSNHWFSVYAKGGYLEIEPWADINKGEDACGEKCVLVLVQRWLTHRSQAATPTDVDIRHDQVIAAAAGGPPLKPEEC